MIVKMPVFAAALMIGFVAPAFAHHSFSMFDADKTVTLQGAVKEFEWTNPHAWLRIMVDDAATGKAMQYAVEMGSPGQQARVGWKPDSVKPGDKISAQIHPLRTGAHGGQLMSVVLPTGQKLAATGRPPSPVTGE